MALQIIIKYHILEFSPIYCTISIPLQLFIVAKKEELVVDEEFSKEQLVVNYIKSMLALEQAMEPYKEQKKDLRKEYIDQGWLSKDEICVIIQRDRTGTSLCQRPQTIITSLFGRL